MYIDRRLVKYTLHINERPLERKGWRGRIAAMLRRFAAHLDGAAGVYVEGFHDESTRDGRETLAIPSSQLLAAIRRASRRILQDASALSRLEAIDANFDCSTASVQPLVWATPPADIISGSGHHPAVELAQGQKHAPPPQTP